MSETSTVINLTEARLAASKGEGPTTIDKMSDAELDTFLIGLHARRLKAQEHIKAVNQKKQELSQLSAKLKVEKKVAQVVKHYERVEAALEKLEASVHEMRALMLQYE